MTGVRKHSITIRGHRTSFSLEAPFFDELVAIAARRGMKFAVLVAEIDVERPRETNLSSALRIYVLDEVKKNPAG